MHHGKGDAQSAITYRNQAFNQNQRAINSMALGSLLFLLDPHTYDALTLSWLLTCRVSDLHYHFTLIKLSFFPFLSLCMCLLVLEIRPRNPETPDPDSIPN